MHINVTWVGARLQGHLFLLLSMWGGTRQRMTVVCVWGGASCLWLRACAAAHTTRVLLTRPVEKWFKSEICSACVHTCNLMHEMSSLSKYPSKTILPAPTSSSYQPILIFPSDICTFKWLKPLSESKSLCDSISIFFFNDFNLSWRQRSTSRPFLFPVQFLWGFSHLPNAPHLFEVQAKAKHSH